MPFDGTIKDYIQRVPTLGELAAELDICGIRPETLNEHKISEAAKYPASWAYHHRETLQTLVSSVAFAILIAGSVTATIGVSMMALGLWHTFLLCAVSDVVLMMMFFVIAALAVGTTFRAGAQWEESYPALPYLTILPIPDVIKGYAKQFLDRNPNLRVVYGELKQNQMVLDPYLMVEDCYTGERIILGIWDDNGIVHLAQQGKEHEALAA